LVAFRCEPALLCLSYFPNPSESRPRSSLHFLNNTDTARCLFSLYPRSPSISYHYHNTHSLVQTHALGVTFLLRPSLGSFTERTVG
jgi:hypothetical protein